MSSSKFRMMSMDRMASFGEQPLYDGVEESDAAQADGQKALLDASHKIALICADLIDAGLSEHMVAEAMMGATIHFYDAAGLADKMPDIFRLKADRIQQILLKKDERHN